MNASLYLNYQVFSYVLMETSIQQSVFNKNNERVRISSDKQILYIHTVHIQHVV